MNNIRWLIRNIADAASLTAVPALVTGLPHTNLQRNTERERTARTSGLASQDFNLLWTSDQKINMTGFTRVNWSTAATLRSRLFMGGSPSTSIYDSTALAAFSLAGLDTDIDIYTERDFAAFRSGGMYFPLLTNMQAATLTVADGANPDGYISQTRLWMGKYFEFAYHAPFGAIDIQIMDGSVGKRADDGTHIVDKKWKARKFTLNLSLIPQADFPTVIAAARYLGTDKESWISLFPNAGGALETYGQMACRLSPSSPVFSPLWSEAQLHKTVLIFEET